MSMSKEVQCALGPVHTNSFSNENRAVLLRIRLSSTLQRRIPSPKTEPFENALHSGAIWKRCCSLVWTEKTMLSKNGNVIKLDTTGRQTTRPWVSKMEDRSYHVASLLIGVCSVDGWKRYDANLFENGAKQLLFRLKTD